MQTVANDERDWTASLYYTYTETNGRTQQLQR